MGQVPDILSLSHDGLRLEVAPALGGSLMSFDCEGQAVLRAAPVAVQDPLESACFPLVPFSNRVAFGRFRFAGEEIDLPCVMPGEPHAIHGVGWQSVWSVVTHEAERIVLALEGGGDGWPWAFRAEQHFHLSAQGLRHGLAVTNLSPRPMPAGMGLHPYFPRSAESRLMASFDTVWQRDADHLPHKRTPLPACWDFSAGRALEGLDIDHCFEGWEGVAEISLTGELVVRLAASASLRHVVLYVPEGEAFFCFEPVSHMPDAFNRQSLAGSGFQVLAPGASMSGVVDYTVLR